MNTLGLATGLVYPDQHLGTLKNEFNYQHPVFANGAHEYSLGVYREGEKKPLAIAFRYDWAPECHDEFSSVPVQGILALGRLVGLGKHLPPADGWPGRQGGMGLYELASKSLTDMERMAVAYRGLTDFLKQEAGYHGSGGRYHTFYATVPAGNSPLRPAYTRAGFEATGRQRKIRAFGNEHEKTPHDEFALNFSAFRRQYFEHTLPVRSTPSPMPRPTTTNSGHPGTYGVY